MGKRGCARRLGQFVDRGAAATLVIHLIRLKQYDPTTQTYVFVLFKQSQVTNINYKLGLLSCLVPGI